MAILSVGLLGLIIYFAVSPRSSRILKLTAFCALGLIVISLGVCGFLLVKGPGESTETIPIPVFIESQQPAKSGNTAVIIGFFAFFLLVLALIIYIAIRDQQKKDKNKSKGKAPVFSGSDELDMDEPLHKDDESFDIETE